MASPTTQVVQITYQNPDASMPMYVPVAVVCNTSDEVLERNIRRNAALDLKWVEAKDAHHGVAIMVGGGGSLDDQLDTVREMARTGTVFAMNAASAYLRERGIPVDYQVIADAKRETAQLVDPQAERHLFASQCHPDTIDAALDPVLWHLETGEVEQFFPEERVANGGYVLIGGGASVGNSALCVAYAIGFRELHIFGYDSCHKDGRSHVYPQPMNQFIPTTDVEWAGKTYTASVAMKAQAEKFQITSQALKQAGCSLTVYGEGLLQAMYTTPPKDLSERDKYRLMWQFDGYRDVSPGEEAIPTFLDIVRPDGLIVDFGCGTGRAALALAKAGHDVFLVDFADNCRDEEALRLPFLEWDLSRPCPIAAPYGVCCDVMEHIPTRDVATVIENIMGSAGTVFFQISTVDDVFGAVISSRLHMTVKPHDWWRQLFTTLGYRVAWELGADAVASQFVIKRN